MPPIFMLHHVSDDPSHASLKPYSISHDSFLRLLDYLQQHQFATIGFEELQHKKRNAWFKKQVILTFDDCPKHLWDFAIPELLKRNMKAVFYMPTAHLGELNNWDIQEGRKAVHLMDESDLRNLVAIGMEVGSHAHQHVRMNALSFEEVELSLIQSKKTLENITGKEVISMAYPFGEVPLNFEKVIYQAGYQYALSIFYPRSHLYALRRIIYHDGDNIKTIRFKVSILYKIYRSILDRLQKYAVRA